MHICVAPFGALQFKDLHPKKRGNINLSWSVEREITLFGWVGGGGGEAAFFKIQGHSYSFDIAESEYETKLPLYPPTIVKGRG
jgi:hypothetical protein